MPPHFTCSICASCDHLSRVCWMLLCPCNHLVVRFRWRMWLHKIGLGTELASIIQRDSKQRTSSKSHSHTFPFSSPHTTFDSSSPKHPRIRYESFLWPTNLFSIFPVDASISRKLESRQVTRKVCPSCVGTTFVTDSVDRLSAYSSSIWCTFLRPI